MFPASETPGLKRTSVGSIVCLHCLCIIGMPNREQQCECKSLRTRSYPGMFFLEIKLNAKYGIINHNPSYQQLFTPVGPRDTSEDQEYCDCCKKMHYCSLIKIIRNKQGFEVRCCVDCNEGD